MTGHTIDTSRKTPSPEHGSSLAVMATLRAAATRLGPYRTVAEPSQPALRLVASDFRHERRAGRRSHLVVFLVDASGSMGAQRRMTATKEAVLSLLLGSYQRRDHVGVITMRGEEAQVLLAPTGSSELAARRLTHLATGGRSPIAAGLDRTRQLLALEARRHPDREALLVCITDGRANVGRANVGRDGERPLASALQAAAELATERYPTLVVDTEQGAVRLGLAGQLAAALGGRCVRLDDVAGSALSRLVHLALGRPAPGPFHPPVSIPPLGATSSRSSLRRYS